MALVANKVVCITGSSRGIGRACALDFVKHGASALILHYFGDSDTESEVQSLRSEVESNGAQVVTVAGDIGDPTTSTKIVDAGVKAFGRIDVLVSNAAVANVMKSQSPPGGSIIGISSISALVGGELQCHYTPTKAGILSLMQSCAIALGKYGIRANAVLPGTIATDINKEDLADEEKRKYTVNRTVLKRLGAPDDISGPVVFLASDLAKYVTGASLLVDGGLFVNLQ
ncbi:hypothetical protein DXG01_000240 [Tephrocybe rancida]|nr:hypothetical protein DXG01_000240 [Tephrocybe rancida]